MWGAFPAVYFGRESGLARGVHSHDPVANNFNHNEGFHMLRWAVLFLVIALISAMFGFTDVAGTSMVAAKIVFFVFLVMFVVTLVLGNRGRSRDII